MGHPGISLTGKRFGRLVVIGRDLSNTSKHDRYWLCKCDCGNTKSVTTGHLTSGTVRSCGCIKKEMAIERIVKACSKNIRHGEAGTKLYYVWNCMRQRCGNPKSPSYKYYGGKGVQVCDEWKDYENFAQWSRENGFVELMNVSRGNNCL